jgi:hypothetical protein
VKKNSTTVTLTPKVGVTSGLDSDYVFANLINGSGFNNAKNIQVSVVGGTLALNVVAEGSYTNLRVGSTTYTNSQVLVYSNLPVASATTVQVLKNSTTVLAVLTILNTSKVSNIDLTAFTLVQGDYLGLRIVAGDVSKTISLDSTGLES